MLSLKRIFRNYESTGSFGEQINLFGFIDDRVFLTKTGALGMVLEVRGVDYECLDGGARDGWTKRFESASKIFDEDCRVYQYLFKRDQARIPAASYGHAVVDAAVRNRVAYLNAKEQYALETYFVILFEGTPFRDAASAFNNPFAWFPSALSTKGQVVRLDRHLQQSKALLMQRVENFLVQVNDFLAVRILNKHEAFRMLKKLLNFDPRKLDNAKLVHDTFLDYYLPESHLECHRGCLRVDEYYVKVLTLKEPPAETAPLVFRKLLEVQANFFVVTEWKKEDSGKTRRVIQAKRRHFHNTKRSFFSQVNLNDSQPSDVLLDDSKESQVRELGEGIKELELFGNYFGHFSLSVVIYDTDPRKVDEASSAFYKVFSVHDAQVFFESYNLLNAFLACVPGNHPWNLRYLYLLNTNYADVSFIFGLSSGEIRNAHLRTEYLAVLESNFSTPYFFNLHYRDVAHSMVLGRTGSGKFFSLSRQPKCIPIIATQSISSLRSALPGDSWRTLLQTFRTKIFLSLSDDFSARTASELCGREDRLKVSYNLSESGHDAAVSLLTGNALSHRANITASKSYNTQSDYRFDMKTFTELKNAQSVAIAYDGFNPKPPVFCYLKPYYNDPNKSYFEQLTEGVL